MKLLLGVLLNRWTLTIVGVIAIALLVWLVFPIISINQFRPYEAEWVRALQIAFIVLAPIVRWVWGKIKARRATAALTRGLVTAPPPADTTTARTDPGAEEQRVLRERFEEALGLLRKLSGGAGTPSLWARIRSLGSKQYLYDLPWYVFIGAPGAGKTTALANSGLRFPITDRPGRSARHADPRIAGVGGTRNCHWWFTDEAVFLDTAGRYTTQDSNEAVDAAAWKSFLGLLKQSRPRRPINGVIVTVSVEDLLQRSGDEIDAQARAIRARVHELYQQLGLRFPIYVLVTKSDLLAGFTEFFADLGREERAQVWGFTLPVEAERLEPTQLTAELARLEGRLYERLPERLEEERDPTRRALLYGFPQQFALLRDRLVQFVDATFAPTKFEAAALLRGVYFASGTQEGSPIDRVMGALARGLRLERLLLPAQNPSGRSYFLTRLLRDVVFPEAGLAGTNLRWERNLRWIQRATITATVVALVVITLGWVLSYAGNREYLRQVEEQLQQVKQNVAAVRAGAVKDVTALLPTLDSVRTLAYTRATPDGSVPWSMRLGLYQGRKLETASRTAYEKMLQDTFLPSLIAFLESSLARPVSDAGTEETYASLKTYLMFYDARRFKPDAVWQWYESRGNELFGADRAVRSTLKLHFDSLYARGWVSPPTLPQAPLVARVRAAIGKESLPERIYDRLKREPAKDLRDFTIAEKGGPKAMLVFERRSGESLTKGVPGFYTKDGYYKQFTTSTDKIALDLADEEPWVMGATPGGPVAAAGSLKVAETVRQLYLDDYRTTWRRFINDITVVRQRDLPRTIEITRTMSGPDSPLKMLMKAIDREVTLSVPPENDPGLAGSAVGKAKEFAGKARSAVTGTPAASLERNLVDRHFEDIHFFVNGPGNNVPPPMDTTVQQLNDLYQLLVAAKAALDTAQTPPADSAAKVVAEAQRQPEPVRSMVQGLATGGTSQVTERVRANKAVEEQKAREAKLQEEKAARDKKTLETRQNRERIDADLRSQIVPFCLKATSDRYPFVRTSVHDVPPEDFTRLFAPNGMFDAFFQKNLAPLVDTSERTWRFKDPALGTSAALIQFQRAQVLRDVFFPTGASTPTFRLEFKPVEMDTAIKQFIIDIDGKPVTYAHGPQVVVPVQFPGPRGRRQIRASISPMPPSGANSITFDGAWAPFRMFDSVKIKQTPQAERFEASIVVEGRRAVFEILATSVRNPFSLPELSEFRCPEGL